MKVSRNLLVVAMLVAGVAIIAPAAVQAATTANSELTQLIDDGTLSTDVRDASGNIVASPSFAMDAATVSTLQQSVGGTFGTNAQRISVDNPGGAIDGWTLALNATVPGTSSWVDGANTYAYNDTAANGQLTVDASTGTLTSLQGTNTGITLAAAPATFTGTTPITIVTASGASDDIWNGYVTGLDLTQTIPAAQPAGSYALDVTQTVTAQ